MPYITQERRVAIHDGEHPQTSGELNYCFTIMIQDYLKTKGLKYATCNDIIGALEGAKLEFYRRIVAPYETIKQGENGDVYG